jgi:hypothetical protein
MFCAAIAGHVEILSWALDNGCPWDPDVPWVAANFGHLDVVKWLHATGRLGDIERLIDSTEDGRNDRVKVVHQWLGQCKQDNVSSLK